MGLGIAKRMAALRLPHSLLSKASGRTWARIHQLLQQDGGVGVGIRDKPWLGRDTKLRLIIRIYEHLQSPGQPPTGRG